MFLWSLFFLSMHKCSSRCQLLVLEAHLQGNILIDSYFLSLLVKKDLQVVKEGDEKYIFGSFPTVNPQDGFCLGPISIGVLLNSWLNSTETYVLTCQMHLPTMDLQDNIFSVYSLMVLYMIFWGVLVNKHAVSFV